MFTLNRKEGEGKKSVNFLALSNQEIVHMIMSGNPTMKKVWTLTEGLLLRKIVFVMEL